MAAYTSNAYKYDIESFEIHSSAAPEIKKEPKRAPLKKVAPRTNKELHAEEVRGLKKSAFLLCFVLVIFGVVALQISASAERYELIREIQQVEALLEIEKSENIRLSSELNGITGIAAVDNYATEILGMTKVENYQIECIDLSGGDAVIYSSSVKGD
ncbi:MAG: hypothetical protein IKL47_10135 [Clostridia bacterium]|nr:hypothetical protein [Clostridia bacterium]